MAGKRESIQEDTSKLSSSETESDKQPKSFWGTLASKIKKPDADEEEEPPPNPTQQGRKQTLTLLKMEDPKKLAGPATTPKAAATSKPPPGPSSKAFALAARHVLNKNIRAEQTNRWASTPTGKYRPKPSMVAEQDLLPNSKLTSLAPGSIPVSEPVPEPAKPSRSSFFSFGKKMKTQDEGSASARPSILRSAKTQEELRQKRQNGKNEVRMRLRQDGKNEGQRLRQGGKNEGQSLKSLKYEPNDMNKEERRKRHVKQKKVDDTFGYRSKLESPSRVGALDLVALDLVAFGPGGVGQPEPAKPNVPPPQPVVPSPQPVVPSPQPVVPSPQPVVPPPQPVAGPKPIPTFPPRPDDCDNKFDRIRGRKVLAVRLEIRGKKYLFCCVDYATVTGVAPNRINSVGLETCYKDPRDVGSFDRSCSRGLDRPFDKVSGEISTCFPSGSVRPYINDCKDWLDDCICGPDPKVHVSESGVYCPPRPSRTHG